MKDTLDDSVELRGRGTASLSSYLKEAQLDRLAPRNSIWRISESSQKLGYLTHNFFRFFGKFPPPVAERFIKELHDPSKGPVLDPMMGSGTTLVEAMRLGRYSIGSDVNPFFVLLGQAKTTYIPADLIRERLKNIVENTPNLEIETLIPKDRYLDHWFFPETQRQLASIRAFIDSLPSTTEHDASVKTLMKVAFASIIRQVSRASKGLGRMFLDPAIQPQNAFEVFKQKVNEMTNGVQQLAGLGPKPVILHATDARDLNLKSGSVGLTICHPPYFNLYRYSSIYRYELLWLGYSPKQVRSEEIKEGFKVGKAELLERYVRDMKEILLSIKKVLAFNAYCVLMIGDAEIKGKRICTTSSILYEASNIGFDIEEIIVRIPKYTEASYAAGQRRETPKVGIKLPDHLAILKNVA